MDEIIPGDHQLGVMIRHVAKLLVPVAADLRGAAEKGETTYLLNYLRSDKPLSVSDREYIAELLQGVLSRPPGRPEGHHIKSRRAALERDFKSIRQHGGTPKQAWTFLAAREIEQLGGEAFSEYGFKPKSGDVEDLAAQLAEWNRRPASRK